MGLSDFSRKLKRIRKTNNKAELALKLQYDEMFDPMILAPHSEINVDIFEAVDRFSDSQTSLGTLKITIFIDQISAVIQEKFKEVYRAHYRDALRKAAYHIRLWYFKVALFVGISIFGIWLWMHTNDSNEVISNLIENFWAFTLWQIGYTFIDGTETWDEYRQAKYKKAAEIEFSEIRQKAPADE